MSDATSNVIKTLVVECEAAQEWIREPDFADNFSLDDLAVWMNRRPVGLFYRSAYTIRELQSQLAASEASHKAALDAVKKADAAGYERGLMDGASFCDAQERKAIRQGRGDFIAHQIDKSGILAMIPAKVDDLPPEVLTYTNWRGEIATRSVVPKNLWYGESPYHSGAQWFLCGFDTDKQAYRDFALADFGWPAPKETTHE